MIIELNICLDDIIKEISEKYNIEMRIVQENDKHCIAEGIDNYLNRSYCTGNYLPSFETAMCLKL